MNKILDIFSLFYLDQIHCPTNQVPVVSGEEFAANPDLANTPYETVSDRFPNRFLFVGDTFYYDDSRPGSDDTVWVKK